MCLAPLITAVIQMLVKVSPVIKPLLSNIIYNREQWKRMGMQLTG